MMVIKALFKQFFGAKYEQAGKSLLACLILFLAINAAEIRMEIAPSVLFLAATALSAGIMWQVLGASQKADCLMGLFALPFAYRKMSLLIALTFTGYTLVTKSLFLLALFFAVREWNGIQMGAALLCACNGCLMAAAWYTMTGRKSWRPVVLLWCGGMVWALFFVREMMFFLPIVLASLSLSLLRLWVTDAYVFYRPAAAKLSARCGRGKGSVFLYLLRYLMTNKNYLLNTAGLCVIAVVLPFILGDFQGMNVMPLGFAILCLNTSVCVLLSCDHGLEQAVRMLPGQAIRFFARYCLFLFSVYMAVNSVYLVSWHIYGEQRLSGQAGGVGGADILAALLIALQSAVLSVWLEWRHPIRNWKLESDLWHHPRKYIVPLVMLLTAGAIGIWPGSIWILGGIVLAEGAGVLISCFDFG